VCIIYWRVWCVTGPLSSAGSVLPAAGDTSTNIDSLTLAAVTSPSPAAGSLSRTTVNSGSTASLPAAAASSTRQTAPTPAVSADLISLTPTTTSSSSSSAAAAVTTSAGSSAAADANSRPAGNDVQLAYCTELR